jgi:hypothetical protein
MTDTIGLAEVIAASRIIGTPRGRGIHFIRHLPAAYTIGKRAICVPICTTLNSISTALMRRARGFPVENFCVVREELIGSLETNWSTFWKSADLSDPHHA